MEINKDSSIAEATERSIESAAHLTPMDEGAAQMLMRVAETVDQIMANGFITKSGKFDNVTIPTYLKAAESLGLTPAGRKHKFDQAKKGAGGKLAHLRAVQGGKTA